MTTRPKPKPRGKTTRKTASKVGTAITLTIEGDTLRAKCNCGCEQETIFPLVVPKEQPKRLLGKVTMIDETGSPSRLIDPGTNVQAYIKLRIPGVPYDPTSDI